MSCVLLLLCHQSQLRRLQREWLQLEAVLHGLRLQHNHALVTTNRGATFQQERLLLVLEEKQALQRDIMAFKALEAWRRLAKARRQDDPSLIYTTKDWVKVSAAVLEPSAMQYYALKPRIKFSW